MPKLTHEEQVQVLATAMREALNKRSRFYSRMVSDEELTMVAEEVIATFEESKS